MSHQAALPMVVGIGQAQVLVVTEIPLTPPAFKVKHIVKDFQDVTCVAITNKVIVTGTLVKDINFKTFERRDVFNGIPRVCGDLRHCDVEIPFSLFVEIPGTREGDRCEVINVEVEGEIDEPRDYLPDNCRVFRTLLERTVIRVVVRVTRVKDVYWGKDSPQE